MDQVTHPQIAFDNIHKTIQDLCVRYHKRVRIICTELRNNNKDTTLQEYVTAMNEDGECHVIRNLLLTFNIEVGVEEKPNDRQDPGFITSTSKGT